MQEAVAETAKSPLPPTLQKIQPPLPVRPSRLGQDSRCAEGEDADAHEHHQDGDGVHDRADYFFDHYLSPSCFSIL